MVTATAAAAADAATAALEDASAADLMSIILSLSISSSSIRNACAAASLYPLSFSSSWNGRYVSESRTDPPELSAGMLLSRSNQASMLPFDGMSVRGILAYATSVRPVIGLSMIQISSACTDWSSTKNWNSWFHTGPLWRLRCDVSLSFLLRTA